MSPDLFRPLFRMGRYAVLPNVNRPRTHFDVWGPNADDVVARLSTHVRLSDARMAAVLNHEQGPLQ
jgi:hypothetical protein